MKDGHEVPSSSRITALVEGPSVGSRCRQLLSELLTGAPTEIVGTAVSSS